MQHGLKVSLAAVATLAYSSGLLCQSVDTKQQASQFELGDYFRVKRVAELTLSVDGLRLAYATEQLSLATNSIKRAVHVMFTDNRQQPVELQIISDARRLMWLPDGRRLAFLSSRSGSLQIYTYDIESQTLAQITFGDSPVENFRISPAGTAVAYTVQPSTGESLYSMMRRAGPAIRVDTARTGFIDFVDSNRTSLSNWRAAELRIAKLDGTSHSLKVPGHTLEFFWSPDGHQLSIVYLPHDAELAAAKPLLRTMYSSVGILDVTSNKFASIARAVAKRDSSQGRMYSGGEWIPGTRKLLLRRIVDANPWRPAWAFPELAVIGANGGEWNDANAKWIELELYPNPDVSEVIPVTESRFYVQTRLKGVNTLLFHDGAAFEEADIVRGLGGSSSLFQFSADFATAAFVNESMSRPPEIYVWRQQSRAAQLSTLNELVALKEFPRVRAIEWKSTDGTTVSGWLMEPSRRMHQSPRPLLTYVHGGPSYAYPDAFSPVASMWPYPLEVLALKGIAVFIPQYRGTLSYGRHLAAASRTDAEPVEDIVSGVQWLAASGIADDRRLGICGYSHGAWLGPVVATRTNMFRVGSFSEGWSNDLVLHELMSSATNRETHEQGRGEPSLYLNPERYLELSPDLHFKGLRMAGLYESGSEALASLMLGMAKAAHYHSVPHEFYVYPKTGHALTSPALQREAAERNLDWFAFWLLDVIDSVPSKESQYARWRQMQQDTKAKE